MEKGRVIKRHKGWVILFSANVFVMVVLFSVMRFLPPEVPLLYGKPAGNEQLVGKYMLLVPPLVALSAGVVNLIICQVLKRKFLKDALFMVSWVLAILSAITVFKITFLVGGF